MGKKATKIKKTKTGSSDGAPAAGLECSTEGLKLRGRGHGRQPLYADVLEDVKKLKQGKAFLYAPRAGQTPAIARENVAKLLYRHKIKGVIARQNDDGRIAVLLSDKK